MRKRKRNIITSNKEIYEKLIELNFSPQVILSNIRPIQLKRILENINRDGKIVDMNHLDDKLILKKIGDINYRVYLK
jgi:hypothetical protein